MLKRFNTDIIIALCTSFAMIAFAVYERYDTSGTVSATTLFIAAAAICLLPVFSALVRCKICRN